MRRLGILATCLVLMLAAGASAQDYAIEKEDVKIGQKEYSPYLNRGYPQRAFWGDTHTHTSLATTQEDNYFGKATPGEPTADPARFTEKIKM